MEDNQSPMSPAASTRRLASCVLVDANLPAMKGLGLLRELRDLGDKMPTIMITGSNDISIAVDAMKAGASDFVENPFKRSEMLQSISRILEHSRDANVLTVWKHLAFDQITDLTQRQKQVMDLVLAGQPSKNIAVDPGISRRTVENHRAEIMKRTGPKSIPARARMAVAASTSDVSLSPRFPGLQSHVLSCEKNGCNKWLATSAWNARRYSNYGLTW